MSTLADAMLAWKANLTTRVVPEQVLTLRADVNAFADDVRLLESENVKLRELVRDIWQSCPVYVDNCYGCEYHRSDGECELYDRMHELGIEVEG